MTIAWAAVRCQTRRLTSSATSTTAAADPADTSSSGDSSTRVSAVASTVKSRQGDAAKKTKRLSTRRASGPSTPARSSR